MTDFKNTPELSESTETAISYSTCYDQCLSDVYNEDCIEVMKRYPDNYFDLAVVDPPYGLGNKLVDGGAGRNGKFDKNDIIHYHFADLSNKDWKVSDYSPI